MKRLIKLVITGAFYHTGIFHLIRLWNYLSGRRLTILTFHRVTNRNGGIRVGGLPTIAITKENFERLIGFIKKHFTVISLHEYLEFARKGEQPQSHCLMLTFDDAYLEMNDNVLPVLKTHNLPAVLFVPTAAVNDRSYFWWDVAYELLADSRYYPDLLRGMTTQLENGWSKYVKTIISESDQKYQIIFDLIEALQNSSENEQKQFGEFINSVYNNSGRHEFQIAGVLDWQGLKDLASGGVELGSHTQSHRFLSTIAGEEAMMELTESKAELEKRFANEVTSFAYPGGKYSAETVRLVEQAGYECAFTTIPGVNAFASHVYELKRINIWDSKVCQPAGKFSEAMTSWTLFWGH